MRLRSRRADLERYRFVRPGDLVSCPRAAPGEGTALPGGSVFEYSCALCGDESTAEGAPAALCQHGDSCSRDSDNIPADLDQV